MNRHVTKKTSPRPERVIEGTQNKTQGDPLQGAAKVGWECCSGAQRVCTCGPEFCPQLPPTQRLGNSPNVTKAPSMATMKATDSVSIPEEAGRRGDSRQEYKLVQQFWLTSRTSSSTLIVMQQKWACVSNHGPGEGSLPTAA